MFRRVRSESFGVTRVEDVRKRRINSALMDAVIPNSQEIYLGSYVQGIALFHFYFMSEDFIYLIFQEDLRVLIT